MTSQKFLKKYLQVCICMVYYTCKQEILYILFWEVFKMLLRVSAGRFVVFHLR